jgi:DNA polymerase III subunit delta'
MFEKVVGNPQAKEILTKSLQKNALPNTLLFHGPKGIGKSLFALNLAQILLQDQKRIEQGSHPDFHLYLPEGKTQMHSIASIRDLIDQVYTAPFEAKHKVFVIQDADRMFPSSANALLKTLEEPLLDTTIILITSSQEDLLPTILSRCTEVRFTPLKEEEIYLHLLSQEITPPQAKELAKLSEGSIGKALAISRDPDFSEKRELLLDLLMKRNINCHSDLWHKIQKLEALYDKTPIEEQPHDLLFTQIAFWERDIRIRTLAPAFLHFLEAIDFEPLKTLPPFPKIEALLEEARTASQRGTKLSVCLEYLFLKL